MRAGGVEVAQQSTVPLGTRLALLLCVCALRLDVGADQRLDGVLGVSVGVGGAGRAVLGNGDHALETSGISVDGSGRGKDNVGDIVTGHGLEQGNGAADIDAPILERDFTGFADGLEGGKVDDIVDVGVLGKDLLDGFFVGDVDVVEGRSLAANRLNAVDNFLRRVVKIVDNDDLVVGLEEGESSEASDVSGSTVLVSVSASAWRGSLAHPIAYPVTRTDPTGMLAEYATMECRVRG